MAKLWIIKKIQYKLLIINVLYIILITLIFLISLISKKLFGKNDSPNALIATIVFDGDDEVMLSFADAAIESVA